MLWHSAVTMLLASYAVGASVGGFEAAFLIMAAAMQWPVAKLFTYLSQPLLPSESVEPLAERLKRGTRTTL